MVVPFLLTTLCFANPILLCLLSARVRWILHWEGWESGWWENRFENYVYAIRGNFYNRPSPLPKGGSYGTRGWISGNNLASIGDNCWRRESSAVCLQCASLHGVHIFVQCPLPRRCKTTLHYGRVNKVRQCIRLRLFQLPFDFFAFCRFDMTSVSIRVYLFPDRW